MQCLRSVSVLSSVPLSTRLRPWARPSWAVLILLVALRPAGALASDDYDPASDSWNGLSGFVAIARQTGVPVEVPARLELGSLTPSDTVVVVYPTEELPIGSLAEFMREGGRVVLADDFGSGSELLSVYQIHRRAAGPSDAPHLRGNDNLPVARPVAAHALSEGVHALVTNHPSALSHHALDPLFTTGDGASALVLAGAVGEGRLVVIADPSMLINNMLQFRDNRRFAENVVRYAEGGRGGRVFIVTTDSPFVGRYGEPGSERPFHDVSARLADIAHAPTPGAALLVFAVLLAAILVVVAVTALPRRSPYDGSAMFGRGSYAGGFVGRVGHFLKRPSNMLHPLIVYKFELEAEIVRIMSLEGRTLLRDVLSGMRRRGLDERAVAEARSLLLELDEVRDRQDRPTGQPRVPSARLATMIARGERLLHALEAANASEVDSE